MTIKYHHHHHPHHLERATVNLHLASQGSQNWRHSLGAHLPWSFLLCVGSSAPWQDTAHPLFPLLRHTHSFLAYTQLEWESVGCTALLGDILRDVRKVEKDSCGNFGHLSISRQNTQPICRGFNIHCHTSLIIFVTPQRTMNLVKYEPPLHNPMLNIPNKSMIFLMQVDPILNNLLRYFPCHWCKACCFSAHS